MLTTFSRDLRRTIIKKRNWMLLGNSSCPPIVGVDIVTDETQCRERAQLGLSWILKQTNIDLVVVSFFGYYFEILTAHISIFSGTAGPAKVRIAGSYDVKTKMTAFSRRVTFAISRLVSAGKQVVTHN